MGAIWDRITSQFIEIVEWLDDGHETLLWRFPVRAQEIKNGAKLVVREGQQAIFVNEGKLADVFSPGTYTLTTQNLPILATLKGWKYGFNSPFKAEVYFARTTQLTDLKWGTQNPIMLRDPEFGPIRLRAFGVFALRIADASKFLREIAGTDSQFDIDEIVGQLRRNLVARFTNALGSAGVPALDLAGNYDEIAKKVLPIIREDFAGMGLEISKFLVENISLPANVEAVLDKRSEMAVLGNVQQYAAYQMANAIPDAARAPQSMAGAGMGLAAGLQMGHHMANMFAPGAPGTYPSSAPYGGPSQVPGAAIGFGGPFAGGAPGGVGAVVHTAQAAPTAPPAAVSAPPAENDLVARIRKLDGLKAAGLLTEEEYAKKKAEILAEI